MSSGNDVFTLKLAAQAGGMDKDGDGVEDALDAFPLDATEWIDTDGDGIGNNADLDDDGDGVEDTLDAFPLDSTESLDTDGDGIGNNADLDDDGDGVEDILDAFPLDATESVDTDGDGIGNNTDLDDDGDGVLDVDDAYPLDPTNGATATLVNNGDFGYVESHDADVVFSISTDTQGNRYQAGAFKGTVDFDPDVGVVSESSVSSVYNDAYVVKTNADGSFAWVWRSSGFYHVNATVARADSQGNVYVGGYFQGTGVDFDSDPVNVEYRNANSIDFFYLKLDSNGQLLWVYTSSEAAGNEYIYDLALDSQNNLYIVGYFTSTGIDFDPGAGSDVRSNLGSHTSFVTRINADGSYAWTHLSGNAAGGVTASQLSIDSLDRIYVSGNFSDIADFDATDKDADAELHTRTGGGAADGFVYQLDSNGYFQWVWTIFGSSASHDYLRSIESDTSGVFIAGTVQGSADFDSNGAGDVQGVGSNVFVTRLNADGSYVNTRLINTNWAYTNAQLVLDSSGALYLSGEFKGTADLDPTDGIDYHTTFSTTTYDIFVSKYLADGSYAWTKTFGGINSEYIKDMVITSDLDLYLTGLYQGTVDFDPSDGVAELTSVSANDVFTSKFSAAP